MPHIRCFFMAVVEVTNEALQREKLIISEACTPTPTPTIMGYR